MVAEQIEARGVKDPRVLDAFRKVERHRFMSEKLLRQAYADGAFPTAHGQTISQPFIVAHMTELLKVEPGHKVLEIGTGSGYQAAILATLGAEVYTMELDADLTRQATQNLQDLGFKGVKVIQGDGWKGWPEHAPYDRIIVTCAPARIPEKLAEQLKPGGRMVLPIGEEAALQHLYTVDKGSDGTLKKEQGIPVRFVPMLE